MKRILFLMVSMMLVSGCAPDPRKEAQAFQIRSQAEQQALSAEVARAHQQELNAVQIQQTQLEQETREATAGEWQHGWNMVLRYGFLVATAAVCFVMFRSAQSVASSFATVTEGTARALVRRAEVRANLIQLDPATRQYPAFIQYLGGGRFSVLNLNTNSVLMLDSRNEPDRQMIAAMGAVQYAGALAQEARQSNDPTGVAMIQAPIVDAKDEVLSIGRDMVRHESRSLHESGERRTG
jgi:hypothetical protein